MKQGGPPGTGDVMPSFRPIQTAPRNAVAAGNQPRNVDPQHLRKPLCARAGSLQPLAFSRRQQTALLERLGKRHPEFSG